MTTRVEGRITLRFHHLTDAADAAALFADLIGANAEVVGLDLVQVEERPESE